jgi:hypothetical protein
MCDEFGDNLVGIAMTGNSWSIAHDGIRDIIFAICQDAGIKGNKEPNNVFNGAVQDNRREAFFNSKYNIKPDLFLSVLKRHDDVLPTDECIYDIKNVFNFEKYYTSIDRGFAVNLRERECKKQYTQHARELDKIFNNTLVGSREDR